MMDVMRHRHFAGLTLLLAVVAQAGVATAQPAPASLAAWSSYVHATEQRRTAELSRPIGFLVMDFTREAARERPAILAGRVVIEAMPSAEQGGKAIEVPAATVQHWRGAVLVSGVTVDQLIARLQQGPPPQEDVLASSVLGRGRDSMKVYLRVRRAKVLTVVYDTEHDVRFERHGATMAASETEATRIVEVSHPGQPDERHLASDDDRGFLWRLNAYWRYLAVPGGVIAECESISLSRRVPFGLRTLLGPLIDSAARESIEAALRAVAAIGSPPRSVVSRTMPARIE